MQANSGEKPSGKSVDSRSTSSKSSGSKSSLELSEYFKKSISAAHEVSKSNDDASQIVVTEIALNNNSNTNDSIDKCHVCKENNSIGVHYGASTCNDCRVNKR